MLKDWEYHKQAYLHDVGRIIFERRKHIFGRG